MPTTPDPQTGQTGATGRPLAPAGGALVERLRAAGCVFAEEEAEELLTAADGPHDLEERLRRRCTGEPLEQVVGAVRWAGLTLHVAPGVFVPRQRTALLASLALERARAAGPAPVVVDLCCGVGAVAALVRARLPRARVHAGDLDPAAVACARRNLGTDAEVHLGDLYDALPPALRGAVDVLAVNAPYVPTGALGLLPREARDFEPLLALDGGADGLDVHRRVLGGVHDWLAPTGRLVVEVGEAQVATYLDLLSAAAMVGEVRRGPDDELSVLATPQR